MSAAQTDHPDTARIGLLLETAQAQQDVIAAEVAQLQAHTRGLDQIVRLEIRRTLQEELAGASEQGGRVAVALEALERAARRRSIVLSIVLAALSALIGTASIAWYLPRPQEVHRLLQQRDALQAQIAVLEQAGAAIALTRCGQDRRWCVRVDRNAPAYGAGGDYMLVREK